MANSALKTQRTDLPPPMLTGTAVVPAHGCWYPPAVETQDLLKVDFDRRAVTTDGLYLIEELGDSGVVWRGCRRFCIEPSRIMFDSSGGGDWMPIPAEHKWPIRIAGYVEQVYKPA